MKPSTQIKAYISRRDNARAQMVRFFPMLAQQSEDTLRALDLNPAAVAEVAAKMEAPEDDSNPDAVSGERYKLNGWAVVAKKGIKRFFNQLAPLNAFSTTYSEETEAVGDGKVLPKIEVPVYDADGEADIDNYSNIDDRASGSSSSVEVELHLIDDVAEFTTRDIQKGINMEPVIEGLLSRIANKAQKFVFSKMSVGSEQGDDPTKKITSITVPAIGEGADHFNYGYANQHLSEAIQPRVGAMLLDSEHYGALKATSRESFAPSDVDVDIVAKVQGLAALGEKAVGLLGSQKGAAVAFKAPLMFKEGYASYQQLMLDDLDIPVAVCTYFIPGLRKLKVWAGTMAGCTVTDVSAIKPLVTE